MQKWTSIWQIFFINTTWKRSFLLNTEQKCLTYLFSFVIILYIIRTLYHGNFVSHTQLQSWLKPQVLLKICSWFYNWPITNSFVLLLNIIAQCLIFVTDNALPCNFDVGNFADHMLLVKDL